MRPGAALLESSFFPRHARFTWGFPLNANQSLKIAVLGGDGTGPEVAAEGLKVLKAVAKMDGIKYDTTDFDFGGDRYLRTGEVLPEGAVDELKKFDAIYLGAIGHPDVKPGILEKGLLLELRFQLDQYINLRPVKLFPGVETPLRDKGPDDIDFVVVRENTEDLYCGVGGFLKKNTPDEVAMQSAVYTRKGCERCIRWAFEYTRKRNNPKKMLTLVAKTNVLTYGHDLWWRTFQDVAKEYPDIKPDYNHVDACCMWMVKEPRVLRRDRHDEHVWRHHHRTWPASCRAAWAWPRAGNINPDPGGTSMFEPMGGSAPKYTGTGKINPIAAINAMAMLLDQTGHAKSADRINKAIQTVTGTKMKSQAAGKMGYSTGQVGRPGVRSAVRDIAGWQGSRNAKTQRRQRRKEAEITKKQHRELTDD